MRKLATETLNERFETQIESLQTGNLDVLKDPTITASEAASLVNKFYSLDNESAETEIESLKKKDPESVLHSSIYGFQKSESQQPKRSPILVREPFRMRNMPMVGTDRIQYTMSFLKNAPKWFTTSLSPERTRSQNPKVTRYETDNFVLYNGTIYPKELKMICSNIAIDLENITDTEAAKADLNNALDMLDVTLENPYARVEDSFYDGYHYASLKVKLDSSAASVIPFELTRGGSEESYAGNRFLESFPVNITKKSIENGELRSITFFKKGNARNNSNYHIQVIRLAATLHGEAVKEQVDAALKSKGL